jgi:hypothetical protein
LNRALSLFPTQRLGRRHAAETTVLPPKVSNFYIALTTFLLLPNNNLTTLSLSGGETEMDRGMTKQFRLCGEQKTLFGKRE